MPKVSIILSSYNHEKYIARAVESVLKQTYKDFELIIYDDVSSDRSADIIRSFHDERIRLFLYQENRGALEAAQEAFASASGVYTAVHHSDDAWEPEKLAKQVTFLDEHPEYAACFTQVSFMDEDGCRYELPDGHVYKDVFQQENRSTAQWLRRFFYQGNCFCHPSLLIRREMYEMHALFAEHTIVQLPDTLMWLKLLCAGEHLYVYPERLTRFRLRRYTAANTSSERPDNTLRTNFEFLTVVREFGHMDAELFQEAFPDYADDVEGNDIRPALGRLCLTSTIPAFRLYGLQLMQSVLQGTGKMRDFDVKAFVHAAGSVDCFNLKKDMRYLSWRILPDYGAGYEADALLTCEGYVRRNGDFSIQADFSASQGLQGLLFYPEQASLLRMRITRCVLNGVSVEFSCENKMEQGYFLPDWQGLRFFAAAAGLTGAVQFSMIGNVQYASEGELAAASQRDAQRIHDLSCRQTELEQALEEILRSKCWRITAPLRKAADWIKRWKK